MDSIDERIKSLVKDVDPPYFANKNWEPGKPVYYSGPVSYTHLTLPTTPYV